MVAAAWTHARWVVIALVVSIALNIFLIGMTGGHHMRGWFHDHDRPTASWSNDDGERPLRRLLHRLTQDLDRSDREQFRAAMDARRGLLTESGTALLDQRRVVVGLLRADPVDRAALDQALAELGQRHETFQRVLMESIADAAESLTPEARAKLGGGWE
jgi:uncharacterized membrane protein